MNLGVKETHVGVFCFNNFALAGHKNRNKIEESSEFDFFSYIQISDELDELKVCTFVHINSWIFESAESLVKNIFFFRVIAVGMEVMAEAHEAMIAL